MLALLTFYGTCALVFEFELHLSYVSLIQWSSTQTQLARFSIQRHVNMMNIEQYFEDLPEGKHEIDLDGMIKDGTDELSNIFKLVFEDSKKRFVEAGDHDYGKSAFGVRNYRKLANQILNASTNSEQPKIIEALFWYNEVRLFVVVFRLTNNLSMLLGLGQMPERLQRRWHSLVVLSLWQSIGDIYQIALLRQRFAGH